jgi:hypothetical protein
VTAPGTTSACACELGRARGHLERAMAELEQALLAWGVWADSVRKLAEQRTGVSVADGFAVLDDPEYARALRLGMWFDEAVAAVGPAREAADAGEAGGCRVCPCEPADGQ